MRSLSLLTCVLGGVAAAALLGLSLTWGYLAWASAPASSPGEPYTPPAPGPASGQVELHDITCDQLVKKVKDLRGHIVVVDVWASYCVPCKREFPGLVRMHQQHAGDGVVCMSISVDEKEQREDALKFLRRKEAAFWNYRLDEKPEVWTKRWSVKAVPLVMVFDRAGQLAAKLPVKKDQPFTYADVEKVVAELLTLPR